jgi:hypothetical protein
MQAGLGLLTVTAACVPKKGRANRKGKLYKILRKVINNLSNVLLVIVNDFIAGIELKIMMTEILLKMNVYSLTNYSMELRLS